MRRMLLALLVVAIGGAMLTAPVAALANEGTVVVAGHGTVGPSSTVTVAASLREGDARGWLRIDNGPGFLFVSRVTCVRVLGDTVLVGGVIVHATNPSLIGHTSLIAVDDGGPGEPDNVGIAFSSSGLDSCPVFALPMNPATAGNVVVQTT